MKEPPQLSHTLKPRFLLKTTQDRPSTRMELTEPSVVQNMALRWSLSRPPLVIRGFFPEARTTAKARMTRPIPMRVHGSCVGCVSLKYDVQIEDPPALNEFFHVRSSRYMRRNAPVLKCVFLCVVRARHPPSHSLSGTLLQRALCEKPSCQTEERPNLKNTVCTFAS